MEWQCGEGDWVALLTDSQTCLTLSFSSSAKLLGSLSNAYNWLISHCCLCVLTEPSALVFIVSKFWRWLKLVECVLDAELQGEWQAIKWVSSIFFQSKSERHSCSWEVNSCMVAFNRIMCDCCLTGEGAYILVVSKWSFQRIPFVSEEESMHGAQCSQIIGGRVLAMTKSRMSLS